MPRKINAQIRAKEAPDTKIQKLCQEKKLHKFKTKKKHLILPYKNYAKKKSAEIQVGKAHNTTLQKLYINIYIKHKIEPKKHLTLPYKTYT